MGYKKFYSSQLSPRVKLRLKPRSFLPYNYTVILDSNQPTTLGMPLLKKKLYLYNKLFINVHIDYTRLRIVDNSYINFDDWEYGSSYFEDIDSVVDSSTDVVSIDADFMEQDVVDYAPLIYSKMQNSSFKDKYIEISNFYATSAHYQIGGSKLICIKKKIQQPKKKKNLIKFVKLHLYLIFFIDMLYIHKSL